MKILILGGTGYIGSMCFPYLSGKYKVDTVDLEWFGNKINKNNFRVDYRGLGESFYKDYDVIILLAGHSSVKMCDNNLTSTFQNNVVNFIDLTTKLSKQQKLIYASSSSLYAGIDRKATEEESSYLPTNYYDLSKKEIDMYAALSGLDYYALRFGTVNGPSKNLRTDLMINKMFLSALTEGSIVIYNRDIHRPILGGKDLCAAIEAIIESPSNPGIYNLASFTDTVGNIAEKVKDIEASAVIDKGNSKTYDFQMSTKKFQTTFNFQFTETTESIVAALKKGYKCCMKATRDEAVIYA